MATLSTSALTLIDWAKRKDPNGKTAPIVELLGQTNAILEDMLWKEGNTETGHLVTVRTGLPSVTWRLLNAAVTPSKSHTAQIQEMAGNLEAWSEVDVDLAKLNGNVKAFRASEGEAFVEAMSQEMAGTIINGNSGTSPEEFTGFAPRYGTLTSTNPISQNVLSGGGSSGTDQTSVYLAGWGNNKVFGVFPKGSKAGLQHNDYGEQTVTGSTGIGGSKLRAYQERYKWQGGLVVADWRYAVRICNIDQSALVAKSSAADLPELMIKATYRIPSLKSCKPVFYMNRTVMQMLDIQRRDDVISGGQLTYKDVDGKRVPHFREIPIKIVDQIGDEAVIS